MTAVRLAWVVLLLIGMLGCGVFVALYAYGSRGWYRSETGRNVMALIAILGGMLTLSLLAFLVRIWPWVWLAGMASLDAALWWRVWILWKVQHDR